MARYHVRQILPYNYAHLTGTRAPPYHFLKFDLAAQNQKGARYLEPAMMHLRLLLADLPACYCKRCEVISQIYCRKYCPYVQRFVRRWLSTQKGVERLKLLRFDKNLMKSTSKILLISEESTRLGEMSPQEARKLGDEKGMEVIIMNKGTSAKDMITCKLFSKLQLKEADKQLRSKSDHKTIEIRSNIDQHDLQIKINKMRQLLDKGHTINLNVFHKSKRWINSNTNGAELQRSLINKVCSELNVTPGKISVGKTRMLTCSLRPNH